MALKQKGEENSGDAKKRRRVGFADIDSGVQASECIKIYLVRKQDEVGTTHGFLANPVDLNEFFGEDGKIYGYKDLKITVWLSIVSFHAYAEISYESTSDGGKGITDLKPLLQNIFGESLIEKEQFLQAFSTECGYIRDIVSKGVAVSTSSENLDDESSMIEVVRMKLNNMAVGLLYSRLVSLVLLLVEDGSPLDVTDPQWDIYLVVKKTKGSTDDSVVTLLGFATVYRFFHYPDTMRFRIGQILVLPPYQGHGHGRRLLESVNSIAMNENAYDVTAEEPSDYLQFLRSCIDTHRMLSFEPVRPFIESIVSRLKEMNPSKKTLHCGPPRNAIELARQELKINRKQLFKCWEVLIYLAIDSEDKKCLENFKACVLERVKGDMVDKESENSGKHLIEVPNDYDHDMTFVVCRLPPGSESDGIDGTLGDKAAQEEQLNQFAEKQWEDIVKIAKKVSSLPSK